MDLLFSNKHEKGNSSAILDRVQPSKSNEDNRLRRLQFSLCKYMAVGCTHKDMGALSLYS